MAIAQWVLMLVMAYGAMGLVFGLVFISFGVTGVDPAARASRWTFRLLILPGVVMLWPLMAARWLRAGAAERRRA